jgi:hypothetical protein
VWNKGPNSLASHWLTRPHGLMNSVCGQQHHASGGNSKRSSYPVEALEAGSTRPVARRDGCARWPSHKRRRRGTPNWRGIGAARRVAHNVVEPAFQELKSLVSFRRIRRLIPLFRRVIARQPGVECSGDVACGKPGARRCPGVIRQSASDHRELKQILPTAQASPWLSSRLSAHHRQASSSSPG